MGCGLGAYARAGSLGSLYAVLGEALVTAVDDDGEKGAGLR